MELDYIVGYIEKSELDRRMDRIFADLGITEADYPLNAIEIIKSLPDVHYEELPFSIGIGGVIIKGKCHTSICLNSRRSKKGKNFDAMHELFHYWNHPPDTYNCYGNVSGKSFSNFEWQANYGAAYGLMPTTLFLRKHIEFKRDISKLSNFFMVSNVSVKYRLGNLHIVDIKK